MQSIKHTWYEITANIIIGAVGAGLITYGVLHLGLSNGATAILSTLLCTLWSIVRQFFIRRKFNALAMKNYVQTNQKD